jgi:polysaccharide chain length determinant protein (PEP-CTERM system associated)
MASDTIRTEQFRTLLLEQAINIWKHRWLALGVAWCLCVSGWIGVTLFPQRYEADAQAFVDVNGFLTPLLKGLVVETTPAQSEGYLRQTLLSRPNLEQVIVLADMGGPSMTPMKREQLVDSLGRDIKVTTQSNNLVSIAYTNSRPKVAKSVVDAMLTVFAEKAANSSRSEMEKAQAFLNEQIGQYEAQLRAAEKRRADFRKKNAKYFNDSGVARPDTLQQQSNQARQQYEEALATRNALLTQIAQVPQLLSVASAPVVGESGQIVAASPQVRLAQAKRHLADLKLVYTEKHPDVVAAEKSVKDLEAENGDVHRPTGEGKQQISNPVYEQLRLKLADSQAQIPVLKQRLDKVTQDYEQAVALSADLPEISAKSQDIDRDYDVIKKNYDELVQRRESANLSQAADDRADRTQFRIVNPPQAPIYPAFPDRLVLYTAVLLLGIIGGAAAPLVMAQLRPTFGSSARLRELGLPVIGAVTHVQGVRPQSGFGRIAGVAFVGGMSVLVSFYGALIFVMTGILRGIW